MSKRFTETTKWADPWYRGLTPKLKSFWQYCLDNCDHAGVWPVDFDLASFCIGEKVTKKEVLESFSTRVVFFGSDKMLVVKFISFQYGTLSPDCKMHRPVFASLSKNRLNYDNLKGIDTLSIGFDTLQDKNKDQDKDQDQEKDSEEKNQKRLSTRPSVEQVAAYCQERGNSVDPQKWHDHYESNGWKVGKNPMKNWQAAVRTWEKGAEAAAPRKKSNFEIFGTDNVG
jgi:hypothetical protein